ncbi:tyrosine recombinase XerC [uncultured Megasphaera sp.]|jgi:integrase|uniref:site-specific integrase n=1 Tax=uncultured Megasphaera sp. TaxID=165188 RepID=UPI00258E10AB|nr:site-specific integrase [uncultured Megasphaera sp.]
MATIRKHGKNWEATAYLGYDDLGRQRKRTKTLPGSLSKTAALREAMAFERKLLKSGVLGTNEQTVSDVIQYWWNNYGCHQSPTTQERNKQLIARINGLIGHIRANKLKPKHIHLFIKALQAPNARADGKGPYSSRTIAMHFKLLSTILNKAVRWELIDENPCQRVDAPKQRTKPQPILQEKDLSHFLYLLLTEAPLKYQAFFMLAFTDGLRRSEICGLDEENIDFEKGTLRIAVTGVFVDGKVIYRDETKTASSAQIMYIAPMTLDILKRYNAERIQKEQYFGMPHCTKLFTNVDGAPILPSTFTHWLHAFLDKHGLPKVNTQGFRKMAVTYAMQKVNLKEASQFARHSNIDTTAKYYAEVLQSRIATPTMYLNSLVEDAVKNQS